MKIISRKLRSSTERHDMLIRSVAGGEDVGAGVTNNFQCYGSLKVENRQFVPTSLSFN